MQAAGTVQRKKVRLIEILKRKEERLARQREQARECRARARAIEMPEHRFTIETGHDNKNKTENFSSPQQIVERAEAGYL